MTTGDDLDAVWATLETSPVTGQTMRAEPLGVETEAGPLAVAVDPSGCPHLLVPVHDLEAVVEDRRSRGVQIVRLRLLEHGEERLFADVVCRRANLREMFERLVVDMVEAVGDDATAPVRALRRGPRPLAGIAAREDPAFGPEQLAGLYAELWSLAEVVSRDPARRVDLWTGPRGGRHDLRRGSAALEVKATTGREGRFVKINGLLQLEPPPDGILYLFHQRLERDDVGESVPAVRRRILALGADRFALAELLEAAGWPAAGDDAYEGVRFSVAESAMYLVEDPFPRIVPSSFAPVSPPGVMRVSYYSDLSGAVPAPLAPEAVEAVWRVLAGAGG